MGNDENPLVTSRTARGIAHRESIEELLTETSRVISSDSQLYYFNIQFNDEHQRIAHRKQILSELDNALDIRSSRPKIEEVGSTDPGVELLIETRMDPETIGEALDNNCLDTVDHWTIDPDAFDLDVADTPECESETVTAEFDQLRQQYADTSGGNGDDLETDRLSSRSHNLSAFPKTRSGLRNYCEKPTAGTVPRPNHRSTTDAPSRSSRRLSPNSKTALRPTMMW